MAEPKSTGGAYYRRQKGLKPILVPLTAEQHQLVVEAAFMARKSARSMAQWAARVLERAAKRELDRSGRRKDGAG